MPVQIELSPGQMNDQPMAELLPQGLPAGAAVIADKGYDADWIRELIEDQACTPHIPPKANRYDGITVLRKVHATSVLDLANGDLGIVNASRERYEGRHPTFVDLLL